MVNYRSKLLVCSGLRYHSPSLAFDATQQRGLAILNAQIWLSTILRKKLNNRFMATYCCVRWQKVYCVSTLSNASRIIECLPIESLPATEQADKKRNPSATNRYR